MSSNNGATNSISSQNGQMATREKLLDNEESSSNEKKSSKKGGSSSSTKKKVLIGAGVLVVLVVVGYLLYKYIPSLLKKKTPDTTTTAAPAPPSPLQQQQQQLPSQDCVLSEPEWGPCVNGVQTGIRKVLTPATNGGRACGDFTATRSCTPAAPAISSDTPYQMGLKFYGNVDRSSIPDLPYKTETHENTLKCANACIGNANCVAYSWKANDQCRLYTSTEDVTKGDADPYFTFSSTGQAGMRVGIRKLDSALITADTDMVRYYQPPDVYTESDKGAEFQNTDNKVYPLYLDDKGNQIAWGDKGFQDRPKFRYFTKEDVSKYSYPIYGVDRVKCAEVARRIKDSVGFQFDTAAVNNDMIVRGDTQPSCRVITQNAKRVDPTQTSDPYIHFTKSICVDVDSVTGKIEPGTGVVKTGTSCGANQVELISYEDAIQNTVEDWVRLDR